MKKILLLALLSLVIYSCKDEDRPIQQEEEVIEEINYYAYSDGHGDYCDSIKIRDEITAVIFRKTMNCSLDPFYKGTFKNSETRFFIDTLNGKTDTVSLKQDFKSLSDSVEIRNYFELKDSLTFMSTLGNTKWEIEIITNKRKKKIYIYIDYHTQPNYFAENLVSMLDNIRLYHKLRILNLQGK